MKFVRRPQPPFDPAILPILTIFQPFSLFPPPVFRRSLLSIQSYVSLVADLRNTRDIEHREWSVMGRKLTRWSKYIGAIKLLSSSVDFSRLSSTLGVRWR